MLWKAEGKGMIFFLSPFCLSPLLSPFLFHYSQGFELALKSYILLMKDSSRKTFYSTSCKIEAD